MRTVTLSVLILAQSAGLYAQNIIFPSRSSEIVDSRNWVVTEFGEGPNILDLHIVRWNGSSWTSCTPGADCDTNAGRLTFGTPLYAPADGWIKTCWRNFDDNPAPGVKLPQVTGDGGVTRTIFTAGNHVNIETPEGNVILIAHMKKGSIPDGLCPFYASSADVTKPSGWDYPSASLIPQGQRPFVKKGQLIGYAGNSGNSTGPHTHIHMAPKVDDVSQGPTIPLRFVDAYAHDYEYHTNVNADGWYQLRGLGLTESNGPSLVRPSPFLRRAVESDTPIYSVRPAFLSSTRVVTASENSNHDLQLVSWNLEGARNFVRKFDVIEGNASQIRIAVENVNTIIVAVRDGADNLKLILYTVDVYGIFTRRNDIVTDRVTSFDFAATNNADKRFYAAMRRQSDNRLKIMAFDVQYQGGVPHLVHVDSRLEDGTVSGVAITGAGNFNGAVAAVRTAEGTLKVIPYKLSGGAISRGSDREAGSTTAAIDITWIPGGVVTAIKDSEGLRLGGFETTAAGNVVAYHSTAQMLNAITEVKIQRTPNAVAGNVAVVTRNSAGQLHLSGWTMTNKGEAIRRAGSSDAGQASDIGVDAYSYSQVGQSARDMLLTAMRDGQGNLRLINWEVNLQP